MTAGLRPALSTAVGLPLVVGFPIRCFPATLFSGEMRAVRRLRAVEPVSDPVQASLFPNLPPAPRIQSAIRLTEANVARMVPPECPGVSRPAYGIERGQRRWCSLPGESRRRNHGEYPGSR